MTTACERRPDLKGIDTFGQTRRSRQLQRPCERRPDLKGIDTYFLYGSGGTGRIL